MTSLRILLTLGAFLLTASPALAGTLWTICDGKLCRSDENGRHKRVVLGFVGGAPLEEAAVSPDGRRVVGTDDTNVFVGTPGGRWRKVRDAGGYCCSTGRLSWRPDGGAFMWSQFNGMHQIQMCVSPRSGDRFRCHESDAGGVDIFGPRRELIWKPGAIVAGLCVRAKPPTPCGRMVVRPPRGYETSYAALSPDTRWIAAYLTTDVYASGRVGIFDVRTGRLRRMWRAELLPVRWSPDGRWVAQTWIRTLRGGHRRVAGIHLRAARGRATRRIAIPGVHLVGWTR